MTIELTTLEETHNQLSLVVTDLMRVMKRMPGDPLLMKAMDLIHERLSRVETELIDEREKVCQPQNPSLSNGFGS
jgi:hypothetical protein